MSSKYVRVVTHLGTRYSVRHSCLYTHYIPRTKIPSCITNKKLNSLIFFKSKKYISSEREQFQRDQGPNYGWGKGIASNKVIKYIIPGAVVCLFADYILSDRDDHLKFNSPMKVDPPIPNMKVLGINIFPVVKKIFNLMPDNMRQSVGIKMVVIFKHLAHY